MALSYKWIILITTCLSTFAAFGYIVGSTSITTVYYIQRYEERVISGLIGPAQLGIMQISCLPALYLSRKIGNRPQQVIGGVLLGASIALTFPTIFSWQGFLLSGVLAGIGGGLLQVATTNVIKDYFPGRQIGPFGGVSLLTNVAAVVTPRLWTFFITHIGWMYGIITIGSSLAVINILCGISYAPNTAGFSTAEGKSSETRRPKLSLLPRRSTSAIFIMTEEELDQVEQTPPSDVGLRSEEENSLEEGVKQKDEKKSRDDSSEATYSRSFEDNIPSLGQTLKKPQSIALVVMSAIYTGGITTCFTVVGDYAGRSLNLSEEQVANALTIQGALQIVGSFVYIVLTVWTDFSSILLHTVSMFILSTAIVSMTFITSEAEFCILIGIVGLIKTFTSGNSVPLSIELTSPQEGMNLYVLKCLFDGVGSLGMPSIAVYIQETFNEYAALYISAAALFCSGSIFVPFVIRYLNKPYAMTASALPTDSIITVNYSSYF